MMRPFTPFRKLCTKHPEALLHGQDVGERIGGVFRETVTFGEEIWKMNAVSIICDSGSLSIRFYGPISAVGAKPIVEVQFADYLLSADLINLLPRFQNPVI
ncbi:hypothetical protein [Halpernia sp. GG3]